MFRASRKIYNFDYSKEFEKIVKNRKATLNFKTDPIDKQKIQKIFELTQRSPSSFNLQPWCAVIVDNELKKKQLCTAALSQNRILQAPLTVVFAASGNSLENQQEMLKMELESGNFTKEKAERIEKVTNKLFGGPSCVQLVKHFYTKIASYYEPTMTAPKSFNEHSMKQLMIAVQTFMLACSSFGIDSHAMEGFDERRVKELVSLPSHYTIPVIVSIGYSADDESMKFTSTRLPTERVFSKNQFGGKLNDKEEKFKE
eukprot:gene2545-3507_t